MNSIVVPSPLVGEGQGEGEAAGPLQAFTLSPNPSPLKGEGREVASQSGNSTCGILDRMMPVFLRRPGAEKLRS
jgi:hypothetical protein